MHYTRSTKKEQHCPAAVLSCIYTLCNFMSPTVKWQQKHYHGKRHQQWESSWERSNDLARVQQLVSVRTQAYLTPETKFLSLPK